MMDKHEIAKVAGKILLDTQSVLFNAQEPFIFTSGRISPVYTDCRRLISFVDERDTLMDLGVQILMEEIGMDKLDYIAGGETAGIPYAAFMADRMNKPMLYIRKKPKGFGRMAQIEGVLDEGKRQNVVLVEDLQTDGGSKKVFIDAIRAAGATVEHAFVIFHYGIFPASEQNMKDLGITLHALTTWWDILEVAKEQAHFDTQTLESVESFLNDPEGWQTKNADKVKKSGS
jgi:orotate phosphoribosyltransferase